MMHVEVCYFHEGVHYGFPGCYHERTEEPVEMRAGWSVQNPAGNTSPLNEEDVS